MGLDTTKKPVKMSFTIENLAKSSRAEKPDQTQSVITNFSDSILTPVKFQSVYTPMTSTPLSLPLAVPNSDRKLKRKRNSSIYSEDSSLNSTDSKSRDCTSPNSCSDDSEDSIGESRKKARIAFTNNQVTELEKRYNSSKYLPIEERSGLAKQLKLSEQQIKTWFQNRRMKEKRQQKDGKNYYFPSGGVEVSQLVAMGLPCPPPHNVNSSQASSLPGYINHQQYTGSPVTQQMFDPRFMSPYMCGFNAMSPVVYPGYNQQFYNGLSPQTHKLNQS